MTYVCNPKKNTACNKVGCGTLCTHTHNPAYAMGTVSGSADKAKKNTKSKVAAKKNKPVAEPAPDVTMAAVNDENNKDDSQKEKKIISADADK